MSEILSFVSISRTANGEDSPFRAAEPRSTPRTSANAWRQNMRIRRNIIAPVVLSVGTIGALIAGPVLAITTVATPASAAVAISAHTDMRVYTG